MNKPYEPCCSIPGPHPGRECFNIYRISYWTETHRLEEEAAKAEELKDE